MANFRAVNNAAAQPGPTRTPITGGDGGGSERIIYDEYTTLGTEVIGDTIEFGPPAGALQLGDRVIGGFLASDAWGVAATLAMGDDGSAARYLAATSVNAAGYTAFNVVTGIGFQADQDRPLRATIAGANAPAGKKVRVALRVLRS